MDATVPGGQSWTRWTFAAGCALAVTGVATSSLPHLWPTSFFALAVAVLAQAGAVPFRQSNRVIYLGWGEAAFVVVVFLMPLGWAPAIMGLGAALGQCLYRIRTGTPLSFWRVASNATNQTIAATAGALVARAVTAAGIDVFGSRTAVGLIVGAFTYATLSVSFVNSAFATSVGDLIRSAGRTLLSKLPMVLGSLTIGFVFIALFQRNREWLLVMPAVLVLTYQAYVFRSRVGDERRIWREFAELTHALNSLDERGVAVAAVTGIQRLFVAAAVEVWVDRLGGSARGYRGTPKLSGDPDVVEMTGLPVAHPVPPNATRPLAIGGVRVGEVRVWMPPGSRLERREQLAMSAVCEAVAAALHDATAHRALRALAARSVHDAHHDVLTGIPNRATMVRTGSEAVAARPAGARVAVLLADVNRFKDVNDTLGHQAGDELLRVTAAKLVAFAGPTDQVARVTGDKFAILMTKLNDWKPVDDALSRAHELAEEMAGPVEIAGVPLAVEVSIGVAITEAGDASIDELLRRAEVAMYRAKRGAAAVAMYGGDRADEVAGDPDRLSIVLDMREALSSTDQLVLDVLPVVDLDTGMPLAVEVLIRWHHPRRGLLAPAEFVDAIDASDLVAPFTRYVLEHALPLVLEWGLPVSVNLSPRSVVDTSLPTDVEALLKLHGFEPSMLTLEITENATRANQAIVDDVLARLRTLGVRLAVDDFGTGYSSFSLLTRVQVDEVKMDSSFVHAMIDSTESAAIVRTTLDLGRRLGIRVVAEGVESAGQRAALRELGCVAAQGWHLVPPRPPGEIAPILRHLADTAVPDRIFPL